MLSGTHIKNKKIILCDSLPKTNIFPYTIKVTDLSPPQLSTRNKRKHIPYRVNNFEKRAVIFQRFPSLLCFTGILTTAQPISERTLITAKRNCKHWLYVSLGTLLYQQKKSQMPTAFFFQNTLGQSYWAAREQLEESDATLGMSQRWRKRIGEANLSFSSVNMSLVWGNRDLFLELLVCYRGNPDCVKSRFEWEYFKKKK